MRTLILIVTTLLLATTLQAQSVSYQDRLYYTCKVWGLLKYNHSEVSTCKVDWDDVLLTTLPAVKAAEDVDAFNDVLNGMFQAAGPMAPPQGSSPNLPEYLIRNRSSAWLQDAVLRADVRDSLQVVLDNFRPHEICHAKVNTGYGSFLLFPGDDPNLDVETQTNFPDESHRLLCMFTYWNILAWFNPNTDILDVPWDSTLQCNILDVAEAQDADAFYDSYRHMASALNDAHVNGRISRAIETFHVYGLKIVLGWSDDGYVVLKSDVPEIEVGDLFLAMDGKSVEQLEEEWRAVMSSGNPAVFRRDFCTKVLRGEYYSPIEVTFSNSDAGVYTYAGKRRYAMNSSWHYSYYPSDSLADVTWKVLDGGVGYVHMGNLTFDDVPSMYNDMRNLPAIIFDVRNYPQGSAPEIAKWMYPCRLPAVWLLVPDVTYPGTYYDVVQAYGIDGNPYAYKGKVIILCNAETQSHAEWSCMVLGAMPGSVVVGSQTAGADGNVSYWQLTRDIQAGFTSLGVFWPDGRQTQRVGIVPDSIVIPTREDIIRGRDPVLIKALQIAGVPVAAKQAPVAATIALEQNYPNPFNSSTTLRFSISRAGHVRMRLTDMLGRTLRTVLDAWRETGSHAVTLDALGLPSGSYQYTLEMNGRIVTRTMTLMK